LFFTVLSGIFSNSDSVFRSFPKKIKKDIDFVVAPAIITTKSIKKVVIHGCLEMKISTRSRYGLRFMVELAANYGKGALNLKDIAKSQDISDKYLSQIVVELKSARLLDGFRGAHGGYVLAKPPAEITVYDIVAVLEGDIALVECARNPALCSKASQCISHEVWHKLGQVMIETLQHIKLADLLKRRQEKLPKEAMYYI